MNMHAKWEWTDERVTALRDLRARGFSASEIMREIGAPPRNAVIGKSVRLGLPKVTPVPRDKAEKGTRPATSKDRTSRLGLNPKRIAKKAAERERERDGLTLVPDLVTVGTFDQVSTRQRPDVRGVLFLDRRPLQCAMPLPGWDALPVTEKLVCGLPTVGTSSWCEHCLPVVTTPSYRSLLARQEMLP